MIRRRIFKLMKWSAVVFGVGIFTLLGVRTYDSQSGPPLEPWHTYVPHELSPDELDHASWGDYLKAEEAIFDRRAQGSHPEAGSGRTHPGQSLFRRQPDLPGPFRPGLEPFLRDGAGGQRRSARLFSCMG